MFWETYMKEDILVDLGISIGIFLLFLFFRKLFAKYVFTLLLRLSRKAPNDFFLTYLSHFKSRFSVCSLL